MRNGKAATNPARLARAYRVSNTRERWLNIEEEITLRSILEEKYSQHMPEFDLALNTGLRRGEMYRLRWEDVDLEGKTLRVVLSKNGESRQVRLNEFAVRALMRLRTMCEGKGWVFMSTTGGRLQGPRHWFGSAVAEAGLENFHWHDLRHTFASRLVMAGVDLRTVQELMGHKSIQVTVRYSHLAQTHQLAAVDRLAIVGKAGTKESATDPITDLSVFKDKVAQSGLVQ